MRTLRKVSTSVRLAAIRLDRPRRSEIKIEELREITDWEKPIYVKVGARGLL